MNCRACDKGSQLWCTCVRGVTRSIALRNPAAAAAVAAAEASVSLCGQAEEPAPLLVQFACAHACTRHVRLVVGGCAGAAGPSVSLRAFLRQGAACG